MRQKRTICATVLVIIMLLSSVLVAGCNLSDGPLSEQSSTERAADRSTERSGGTKEDAGSESASDNSSEPDKTQEDNSAEEPTVVPSGEIDEPADEPTNESGGSGNDHESNAPSSGTQDGSHHSSEESGTEQTTEHGSSEQPSSSHTYPSETDETTRPTLPEATSSPTEPESQPIAPTNPTSPTQSTEPVTGDSPTITGNFPYEGDVNQDYHSHEIVRNEKGYYICTLCGCFKWENDRVLKAIGAGYSGNNHDHLLIREGESRWVCARCGLVLTSIRFDTKGIYHKHNLVCTVVQQATCTQCEMSTNYCTICDLRNDNPYQSGPMKNHTEGSWYSKVPTATVFGHECWGCTVCGKIYDEWDVPKTSGPANPDTERQKVVQWLSANYPSCRETTDQTWANGIISFTISEDAFNNRGANGEAIIKWLINYLKMYNVNPQNKEYVLYVISRTDNWLYFRIDFR